MVLYRLDSQFNLTRLRGLRSDADMFDDTGSSMTRRTRERTAEGPNDIHTYRRHGTLRWDMHTMVNFIDEEHTRAGSYDSKVQILDTTKHGKYM